MKRFRLLKVTSPFVEIECGGNLVKTKHIKNTEKNPNFPDPVITMDMVSDHMIYMTDFSCELLIIVVQT